MCFNLYTHLSMHFCDTILRQISILQTLTRMVNLMYIQTHCKFMDVKLEWSGFHCFPFIVMFASFISIIFDTLSLIYFGIHAFISKPIHHLNLKDKNSSGTWHDEKWKIRTSKRGKPGSYPQVREALKKKKNTTHLTCLKNYFMVKVWNPFGITMMANTPPLFTALFLCG